jgi:hypothetical protein
MTLLEVIRKLIGKNPTNTKQFIDRNQMRQMLMSGDTFTIHTSKLDGSKVVREVYTVEGPTGNIDYNYESKGYMVFFDETKGDYRTFIFKNITKIVDSKNNEYNIR